MENQKSSANEPSVAVGAISLIILVASIIASIKLGFGTQMSVFVGAVVAIIIAFVLKAKWEDIQEQALENISNCGIPIMILVLVGVLVGVWLIGGTLPSLIYYGLKFISPTAVVPLTFVLCALTSVFTGTSYGSIATMGLAMYGIGANMGIPAEVIAGAVVSGSYFGDKMSPMSDTTNVAPAMAGTDLYSHIQSMCYTTVPATIVVFVIYTFIGMKYAGTSYDSTSVEQMMAALSGNFNINVVCILPLLMVLILSALKVPSVLAMGSTAVASIIIAVLTQGAAINAVMSAAINGYVSSTGVALVDAILTRGGVTSMAGTVAIVLFSAFMAGALKSCGVLDVFVGMLLKVIKSVVSLVFVSLVFCWSMVALTGNQMLGIIIPGKALGEAYDKLNVHRKVLSRSLEDAATIGSAIIPWSAAAAYITSVLGVGIGYIPYAFLCYVVPVFSMICAATGFGIWDSNGQKRKAISVPVKQVP